MATIQITMRQKEIERYLMELGLFKVYNDLMYPLCHGKDEERELSQQLKKVYTDLLRIFHESYPQTMKEIAVRKKAKFEFKDESDFANRFGEYFQKRLFVACLYESAKHPKCSQEQIATKVSKKAKEIFEQSVALVYNEMLAVLRENKLIHGEQPFNL